MTHHIKCRDGIIITVVTPVKGYHECTARTTPPDWRSFNLLDTPGRRNVPRAEVEALIAKHGGVCVNELALFA